MKRALKILLFLGIGSTYAQEKSELPYSAYFTEKSLAVLTAQKSTGSNWYAKYRLKETEKNQVRIAAGEYLVVDETGIYIEKNKILFVTREEVRENSKIDVRNGYLFGVSETDSVPTALDGENYYFLVPAKTYLCELRSSSHKLFSGLNSGEFLLMTLEENNHYTAMYLKFQSGSLALLEPSFNTDKCLCSQIKEHEVTQDDFEIYVMSPSLKEWQTLFGCFAIYDQYVVIN
jgi:hypothetical protein